MRRFKTTIALLLVALSLTSCGGGGNLEDIDFDILETKNIVLGNEVASVELTTEDGEKMTVTNETGFYEILDESGFVFNEDGKKYSCHAEMKLGDQSKSFVNTNIYYLDDGGFIQSRVKKEGSNDVALIEEYSKFTQLENNEVQHTNFSRYIYKGEKAFGGRITSMSENTYYQSNTYPNSPESGTELYEMQSRADALTSCLISTVFLANYEPVGEMDFNQFVTREYTLYENYIVFKQTAPFLDIEIGLGQDIKPFYTQYQNSTDSITQEAYYNVKTGEIELVKAYGTGINHAPAYVGFKLEIDMQVYIHTIVESEYQEKLNKVIAYVKANADN